MPGTVQGGPLNVNDERNAYVTGKFGRNCGDNDDQSRIVSDIHLSNGSPVKIYRSMKGKEEEDKKRAMEAKLRKEMEDKLAKERAKEVKKKCKWLTDLLYFNMKNCLIIPL